MFKKAVNPADVKNQSMHRSETVNTDIQGLFGVWTNYCVRLFVSNRGKRSLKRFDLV